MPFCQKCGEAYKEGEQFCPKCGAKTGAKAETAAPAPKAEAKKVTKITVSGILAWIIGVLIVLAGLGQALNSLVGGLLMVLGGLILLPPTNNLLREKLKIELSGWIRVILFLILLAIGMSMGGLQTYDSDVVVQPTENIQPQAPPAAPVVTPQPQAVPPAPPAQKVKSATISVDRVVETAANLGAIRITIQNTGDVSIRPKFDVTVTDSGGNVVCEGSPFVGVGSIAADQKKTDEITLLVCTFSEDGDYIVKVDLLDKDFTKLDSGEKSLTVNYWGGFGI